MKNETSYIFTATERQNDNGAHFQSCVLIGAPYSFIIPSHYSAWKFQVKRFLRVLLSC